MTKGFATYTSVYMPQNLFTAAVINQRVAFAAAPVVNAASIFPSGSSRDA